MRSRACSCLGCGFRRRRTAARVDGCKGSFRAVRVKSATPGGLFRPTYCSGLARALALECEAMGGVHETVEDGVGHRRVGDHVVPAVDGELAGDDGAGAAVAVVDDLQ